MPGFCVATSKRAQLISRCRHFCVQQPEHSTPSSGTAGKSCFSLSYIYIYIFFLSISVPFSSLALCTIGVCPNKVFITRAVRSFPQFSRFSHLLRSPSAKNPWKTFLCLGFHLLWRRNNGLRFLFSLVSQLFFLCSHFTNNWVS